MAGDWFMPVRPLYGDELACSSNFGVIAGPRMAPAPSPNEALAACADGLEPRPDDPGLSGAALELHLSKDCPVEPSLSSAPLEPELSNAPASPGLSGGAAGA